MADFPAESDIADALARLLAGNGGQMVPKETYKPLADQFRLTNEMLSERIGDGSGRSKWNNMVQWARNDLVKAGWIDKTTRNLWQLTSAGLRRAEKLKPPKSLTPRQKAAIRTKATPSPRECSPKSSSPTGARLRAGSFAPRAAWVSRRSRSIRMPMRARRSCSLRTRRCISGLRPPPRAIWSRTRSSPRASRPGPRRCIRAMASCPSGPASPRRSPPRGSPLSARRSAPSRRWGTRLKAKSSRVRRG